MANNFWIGSTNNNWNDGSNWSEGLPPSLLDNAIFGISGNANCVLSEASSAAFVDFDSYTGSFNMNSNELFVTDGITFDLNNNTSPVYDANINVFGGVVKIIDTAGSSIDTDIVIHDDITFFSSGSLVATSWLGSITPSMSGQHTIIFDADTGVNNSPIIYFFDENGFLNRKNIVTENSHVVVWNPSLTAINNYYFGTESVTLSGGQLVVRSDKFVIHFQTKIIVDALGGRIDDSAAKVIDPTTGQEIDKGQEFVGGIDLGGVLTIGSTGGFGGISEFNDSMEDYAFKLLSNAPECKIINFNRSTRQIRINGKLIEETGNVNPLILETNGSTRDFFLIGRNDITSGLIVTNTKSGFPSGLEGIAAFGNVDNHPLGLGYVHIKGGTFRHVNPHTISGDFIISENSTFFNNSNADPLNIMGDVQLSGAVRFANFPSGKPIEEFFNIPNGSVKVYDGAILTSAGSNNYVYNIDNFDFMSPITNVKFGQASSQVTFEKFEIDSGENVLLTFEGNVQLSGSPILVNNGTLAFEAFTPSSFHELRFVAFNTEENIDLSNVSITSGTLRFTNNTFNDESHGTSIINITGSENILPITMYFTQSYGDLTINATGILRTGDKDFEFETQLNNTTEESSFTFNGDNLTMVALADFQTGFTFKNNTTVTDSISASNIFNFKDSKLFTYYNFDTDYPSSKNLNNKLILNNTKIIATACGYDTFSGFYSFHEIEADDNSFIIITGLPDTNSSPSNLSLRSQLSSNNNNDGRGAANLPLMVGYKSFDKEYDPRPSIQDGTLNNPIVIDENYVGTHNLQDPPSGVYKFFQVEGKVGYKLETYDTGDDPDTNIIIHEDSFDWKNAIDANEDRYDYGSTNYQSEYIFPNNRTYYVRVTGYGLNEEDPNDLPNSNYGIRMVPFEDPRRTDLDVFVGSSYTAGNGYFKRLHLNAVNVDIRNNTNDLFTVTDDFVIGENATFELEFGGKVMNVSGSFELLGDFEPDLDTVEFNLSTNLNNKNIAFVSIKDVNCVNEKLNVVRAKNAGGNTNINFRRV